MAIPYIPGQGTIVICDFKGYVQPEMVKRRPAIVVSPRFRQRPGLCTIVPCSTTAPHRPMPYHYELTLDEALPCPYDSLTQWVKCDMFCTVSLDRLFLPYNGKDANGKRDYIIKIIDDADMQRIRECMLNAMGLSHLTPHL